MNKIHLFPLYVIFLTFHSGFSETCRINERGNHVIADCKRLGLQDIPTNLPVNISELDLSYNNISFLKKYAFERFRSMTVLNIDNNNVDRMEPETFMGLTKLRLLSMKHNKFDISSTIFKRIFKPLSSLNHLDIRNNMDKLIIKTIVQYPFFGDLLNLIDLYIDLAEKPIFNSSGFELLLNLHTIRFETCYLKQMLNDTLIYLPSNITTIYFHKCYSYISFVEPNFLRPFPALTELNMHLVNIKLEDALTLLYPFTGKEMASIIFKRLEGSAAKPVFITGDMVKYLIEICVHTLVLAQSDIVGYEQHSLLAFKYPQCLKYVVFSGNRFSLSYDSHLIELLIFAKKATNLKFFDISYNAVNFNSVKYCNIEALKNDSYRNEIYNNGCEVQYTNKQYSNANSNENFRYSKMADGSNTTITLPDNLTFFRCSHYMTSYIEHGVNMFVRHSDSLRYVDLSYFKIAKFPEIYSVTPFNIKYFDLSGFNSMLFIHKSSVHIFQNVETAILKDARIDETIKKNGNIFKLFPTVEKFDISYNTLWYLNEDSFLINTKLKNLNMANNLLSAIPNAVMSLSHLNTLDIRYNRIQTIDETVRAWLDAKSESENFYLFIKGNSLKCTCETANFIEWLFQTKVIFDQQNKKYNCTLTNGTEANMLSVYKRFHDHFGECNNKNWLRIGIVLLASFVIFTIPFAIIYNFRWKITYWIYINFRKVVEHRLEKKFKYDIYLAYADDKIQWAREVLLPRIECSWNMTVCLEDRDFSVGMAKADAIASAVAESKHAIFIISEIYQHDAWSKYEIERIEYEKCSNYMQKIVVIVKDESISCIPSELKNILQHLTVIEWTDDETAWDKLRMALFTESY